VGVLPVSPDHDPVTQVLFFLTLIARSRPLHNSYCMEQISDGHTIEVDPSSTVSRTGKVEPGGPVVNGDQPLGNPGRHDVLCATLSAVTGSPNRNKRG